MSELDPIEQHLHEAYGLQTRCYEEALRIVTQGGQAPEPDAWVRDLQRTLARIAELDAAMSPAKAAWQQSQRSAGPHLRGTLDQLKQTIHDLAAAIDRRAEE